MTTQKLTDRQEKVVAGIKADKTPAQIAKEMNISVNGVYGHIRRLKKVGALPGGKAKPKSAASPRRRTPARATSNGSSALNGSAPLADSYIKAKAEIEKRISDIDEETKSLSAERDALANTIA